MDVRIAARQFLGNAQLFDGGFALSILQQFDPIDESHLCIFGPEGDRALKPAVRCIAETGRPRRLSLRASFDAAQQRARVIGKCPQRVVDIRTERAGLAADQ